VPGREHESKPAAHAESDDADPTGAPGLIRQRDTRRFDIVECLPLAGADVPDDGQHAGHAASP
jgi:hypothetical protein